MSKRKSGIAEKIASEQIAEAPSVYADKIGHQYASAKSDAHRKLFGLYLTPEPVSSFMASWIRAARKHMRILDPAAGAGILLCSAVEELVRRGKTESITIVAYEIDPDLAVVLRQALEYLAGWAVRSGVKVTYEVKEKDFVLSECISLPMLESAGEDARFDLVVGNPPYFKISKADPRASAASDVVYGQPNIYGVFMAVSAAVLQPSGEMIFITPRSFASGPYFKKLREWFFERMRPVTVHVFDSRKDAFGRDEVLQENVIIHSIRERSWNRELPDAPIVVSTSHGLKDLADSKRTNMQASELIAGQEKVLRIPASKEEAQALRRVESWSGSLGKYGMNISTGPVVAFRAHHLLRPEAGDDTVPLVWLNHVFPMEVHWPNGVRKPQHLASEAANERLLVPRKNYVIMRRFSAKEDVRRLTAAPLLAANQATDMIGLENHLNYLYRPGSELSEDEAWGLAALFSSQLLDSYFRCVNGNTQVSATELRTMPLPDLGAIKALGRKVKMTSNPFESIDKFFEETIEG